PAAGRLWRMCRSLTYHPGRRVSNDGGEGRWSPPRSVCGAGPRRSRCRRGSGICCSWGRRALHHHEGYGILS
ncbi:hypothetical protein TGFOU_407880, partial [Toxoplasma gondii FOU]